MFKKRLENYLNNLAQLFRLHPSISCLMAGIMVRPAFNQQGQFIWIILSFLILLCVLRTSAHPGRCGFIYGIGYFASSIYWIAESCKCVGMEYNGYWVVLGIALYLALFASGACYISRRFAIPFPLCWAACELGRSYGVLGFPWCLVGHAAVHIPYFAQCADLVSVFGVSCLFLCLIQSLLSKQFWKYGMLLLCIVEISGMIKYNKYDQDFDPNTEIILIQPSIAQELKMDKRLLLDHLAFMTELSLIAKRHCDGALIIWPEAILDISAGEQRIYLTMIANRLLDKKSLLFIGCVRQANGAYYNSMAVVNACGEVIRTYDKRHLVPGGEYIPIWLPHIVRGILPADLESYSEGESHNTIDIPGITPFDVNICFEIIFPGQILGNKNSGWILNIANYAWFRDTDAVYQNLNILRMQAISTRKPIVQCANSGISCVILPNGRIKKMLHRNQIGTLRLKSCDK